MIEDIDTEWPVVRWKKPTRTSFRYSCLSLQPMYAEEEEAKVLNSVGIIYEVVNVNLTCPNGTCNFPTASLSFWDAYVTPCVNNVHISSILLPRLPAKHNHDISATVTGASAVKGVPSFTGIWYMYPCSHVHWRRRNKPLLLLGNLSRSVARIGRRSGSASGVHSTTSMSSLSTKPSVTWNNISGKTLRISVSFLIQAAILRTAADFWECIIDC